MLSKRNYNSYIFFSFAKKSSEQYEETTAFSYVTEGGVTMMRTAVTDPIGRTTSRSHPDAGMTSTAYDAAGNVISVTNAAGETVSYSYDHGGNLHSMAGAKGGQTQCK